MKTIDSLIRERERERLNIQMFANKYINVKQYIFSIAKIYFFFFLLILIYT